MIKKTLYFGNPAYLSLKDRQMVIKLPNVYCENSLQKSEENVVTKPIEDIGVVVLDNNQITITHGLMVALLDNQVAVIKKIIATVLGFVSMFAGKFKFLQSSFFKGFLATFNLFRRK